MVIMFCLGAELHLQEGYVAGVSTKISDIPAYHIQQGNVQKTPMIDVSTQTDLDATPTGIPGGNSRSKTMTRTKAPSTHTFLQLTAPLLTSTAKEALVNTQSVEHESAEHESAEHESAEHESMEHERTLEELADTKAQITDKDEEMEQYKCRLAETTESRDEQTQQSNEIPMEPYGANINIAESDVLESSLEEQADSSQVEVDDLRTALEEAESRVSELEDETNNLEDEIELKDNEIRELKRNAVKTSNYIRQGCDELNRFLRLTLKLYNRLNKAEKMLKDALGRDDRLMRSAARTLARWNVPVETYFRDIVRTEAEDVSDLDLAVIRRPADYSAMHQGESGHVNEVSEDDRQLEQLVDEISGGMNADSDVSGVEGPAAENAESEEPQANSCETGKTASLLAAAVGIDPSSSSPSSTAKGKQKEERSPAFGQEGSRIFSFAPSEDGVRAEQMPGYQYPEGTSQGFSFSSANAFNFSASTAKGKQKEERSPAFDQEGSKIFSFSSANAFNFSATTAKGKEKEEPASVPAFGAEGSNQSSFLPEGFAPTFGVSSGSSVGDFNFSASSGQGPQKGQPAPKTSIFGAETPHPFSFTLASFAPTLDSAGASLSPGDRGDEKQKQESTDKATNEPLFSAEAIAKFGSGSSRGTFDFGDIKFPTFGASESQVVEPASTADTNGGGDVDSESTGVPRITITPASTFEDKVEVGSSNILARNGFDVAALSRIVGLVGPVAHENSEASSHEGGKLKRVNHGDESLLERLLPPEGHYPSYEEATGIQGVVWRGRGRTAEEILLGCVKGFGAKDGMEEDLALITSGIEALHLRPSLPSGGSHTRMENAQLDEDLAVITSRIEALYLRPSLPSARPQTRTENARVVQDDRSTEREVPKDDEPQKKTKVVKEDGRATGAAEAQPAAPLVSQPNESSSATVVESTVQPRMGSQVESTTSSLSSSYSSSSEAVVSTSPTTHEPPEAERRSKNGNPLDGKGRLYLWHVWPLTRVKKP